MRVLLFAGTTEGRLLAEQLGRLPGVEAVVCVATEYGREVLGAPGQNITVISRRLDARAIRALMQDGRFELVVDATHPYATRVTASLQKASAAAALPYMRLLRGESAGQNCRYCATVRAAAALLCGTAGNVLVATGSKELEAYTAIQDYPKRLYPRVLPTVEAIEKCGRLGFAPGHIIAMQGPFSAGLNRALMAQFGIRWLVTKDGGAAGGFMEKMEAAALEQVEVVVVGRPLREDGHSLEAVLAEIEKRREGKR